MRHDDKIEHVQDQTHKHGMSSEDHYYCHQCNKKRDASDIIHCTHMIPKAHVPDVRCKLKYCRACLKNRYNENIDLDKAQRPSALPKKEREKHVLTDGYCYQCPKCRGQCNCRVCRKARGLEPTGMSAWVRKKGAKPDVLPKGRKNKTKKAGAPHPQIDRKASKRIVEPLQSGTTVPTMRKVPKPTAVSTVKAAPKPVWSRVYTPLTKSAAETRIHIREFLLRFSSMLDLNKSQLEELEEISGAGADDVWEMNNGEEMVGWVSETCIKAIVLGLLSVIAEGSDSFAMAKSIKKAIEEVQSSGAILNKIWGALSVLRDEMPSGPASAFQIPDPLPSPPNIIIHNLRGSSRGANAASGVYVAVSAQLVPVIASLIESAILMQRVREEIDNGVMQEKELAKEFRVALAREKSQWLKTKTTLGSAELRLQRKQYQQTCIDLEHAYRVAETTCIPRYAALGQDSEGRVYYALTPSEAEREAAAQLLAGKDGKVKVTRKRGGLTVEDRKEMQRWSWFIAVWGRLPKGAIRAKNDDEDSDDDDESEAEEGWWGFWEPAEIKKLAIWISQRYEADGAKPTNHAQSNSLSFHPGVKGKSVAGRSRPASSSFIESSVMGSRECSPLSDLSEDNDSLSELTDDEEEQTGQQSEGMRIDSLTRQVPTNHELRALVQGLNDFADLLQWRISRAGSGMDD
ncbi:uncharacterized protein LAESUDRAFT_643979 [Laetiporus sulphureus 93-53]|uniref:Zinc-finger domain-containing protein n=1 Tax=Laetiporus sulphureus 93-53 TaxID=1314785 RepID=A0A165GRF3_9APHY|nr:uncharacterized protein LAESUDRAFT_643979 [Laetiporus sulphureus 93-53]KZT10703.1 hypothetical protein LAESUDRAFT_643979 [Laetiporus sulphureus 93-53]